MLTKYDLGVLSAATLAMHLTIGWYIKIDNPMLVCASSLVGFLLYLMTLKKVYEPYMNLPCHRVLNAEYPNDQKDDEIDLASKRRCIENDEIKVSKRHSREAATSNRSGRQNKEQAEKLIVSERVKKELIETKFIRYNCLLCISVAIILIFVVTLDIVET